MYAQDVKCVCWSGGQNTSIIVLQGEEDKKIIPCHEYNCSVWQKTPTFNIYFELDMIEEDISLHHLCSTSFYLKFELKVEIKLKIVQHITVHLMN